MIPAENEYLSFLMGADSISDDDLTRVGALIVLRFETGSRGLLLPESMFKPYRELIRQKLTAGYWNEIISRRSIIFFFKSRSGLFEEIADSPATRNRITRLCSEFNNDPLEKTRDLVRYLAANSFYHDLMVSFHGA